jgi:hypothetical protein
MRANLSPPVPLMFSLLRRMFRGDPAAADARRSSSARRIDDPGVPLAAFPGGMLDLAPTLEWYEDLPHLRWAEVGALVHALPAEQRDDAWRACQRAWLCCLRDALGGRYVLYETDRAFALSAFVDVAAAATARHVDTTRLRVRSLLEELAHEHEDAQILLAFPDGDDYYRYISYFHPEDGEYPMSAGMHVDAGCAHFMMHGKELDHFDPTLVHEMTHSLVNHLPLPAWVNEGMAVNSEQRLTRRGADIWSVLELEEKHRAFWTPQTIQEFWNGAAYRRTDDGNELAYDLGRILVNGMSSEWAAFKRFAAAANLADGGDAAAREHLHLDLGEYVRLFLDAAPADWGPRPATWPQPPERGAFAPN